MEGAAHLYSLAIHLQPERPGKLEATCGHQAHAAFLSAIRHSDPGLAELLHAPQLPLRPFTVSALLGVPKSPRRDVIPVSPESTYVLRVTLLQEPIYGELMRRFLERPGRPALLLGSVPFLVTHVQVTPGSSPWAAYTTWEKVWAEAEPLGHVCLEFLSPTAFHLGQRPWGKRFCTLPDTVMVFRSLLRSWNVLAPPELAMDAKALESYLQNDVVLQRVDNLRTVMWRYPDHMQIGFVGRAEYGFKGEDADLRRQLNALADFAFYAGVGYKTTMGMGQVRRMRSGQPRQGSGSADDRQGKRHQERAGEDNKCGA